MVDLKRIELALLNSKILLPLILEEVKEVILTPMEILIQEKAQNSKKFNKLLYKIKSI